MTPDRQQNVLCSVGSHPKEGILFAGITAACLGAENVFLTDFMENLPLLEQNCVANTVMEVATTMPLVWGREVPSEIGDIDVILATDIMYYDDAVKPLLATLHSLSGHNPHIFVCLRAEPTSRRNLHESFGKVKLLYDRGGRTG